MTAWVTFSPRNASASAFSLPRIIAEISGAVGRLPIAEDHLDADRGLASGDLVRDLLEGALHLGVAEPAAHEALDRVDRVLPFVMACRLATWPTRRSPLLVW